MITRSPIKVERQSWQQALADAITCPQTLLAALKLDKAFELPAAEILKQFPLRVPQSFVARMKPGKLDDPLLRQVLPVNAENQLIEGYNTDPLNEQQSNPTPGVLHKYHGRVLLTLTGACAIHCRYCFRRHFPYQANTPGRPGWDKIIDYIQADPTISEVILSGGDPLLLTDSLLQAFLQKLQAIKHLQRLRIHTRLPIVLPERITTQLLQVLTQQRLQTIMVVHCNHAQEIDTAVATALANLHRADITLFNQAVLLKGVNDRADVLTELCQTLFHYHVIPYYLHRLDKVQGAAHFAVSQATELQIMKTLQARLPGYLVPKFVEEIAGAEAKQLILSANS